MIIEQLQKIGFSQAEAKVLNALSITSKEQGFPSVIAKATGLNRYTTYDILERLNKQSLLLKLKRNGKLCYQFRSPDDIEHWLQDKQKKLQQQVKIAETL